MVKDRVEELGCWYVIASIVTLGQIQPAACQARRVNRARATEQTQRGGGMSIEVQPLPSGKMGETDVDGRTAAAVMMLMLLSHARLAKSFLAGGAGVLRALLINMDGIWMSISARFG